jgi:membrane protease YdiL (CAAX protease family)
LLYPAGLVAIFVGCQALGVSAALAALPALLALWVSLPIRVQRLWGEKRPWQQLGVSTSSSKLFFKTLLRGLIKAGFLLLIVAVGLLTSGKINSQPAINLGLLINGIALGLGVGFAEELLFRGWLLGELEFRLRDQAWGKNGALVFQALIFSLAHTRFNQPLPVMLGLLGGLALLGIALGLQRRADGGVIWGAVGLHGGLVGGWFVINQGFFGCDANPIGSLLGWAGLVLLLWVRRRWW